MEGAVQSQRSRRARRRPTGPRDEPEEPTLRRLIVNDATFEAMHQTMSENPAGILVIRDELTGWWSQLDRPAARASVHFACKPGTATPATPLTASAAAPFTWKPAACRCWAAFSQAGFVLI